MKTILLILFTVILSSACFVGDDETPECTFDYQCASDELCEYEICIPTPECTLDRQCSLSEICEHGVCIPRPYTPPPVPTGKLIVRNYSPEALVSLYLSPCGSTSWGTDYLYFPVYSGSSFTIYGISQGCYDSKATSYSWYWERFDWQYLTENTTTIWTLY